MRLSICKTLFLVLGCVAVVLASPYPYRILLVIAGLVLFVIQSLAGFRLAEKTGIVVFGWSTKHSPWKEAAYALAIGLVLGMFILVLLRYGVSILEPRILERLERDAAVPLWKWMVILFHAPILEETTFRLFILSLAAWGLSKVNVFQGRLTNPNAAGFHFANLVAAFLFALVHLPGWYQAGEVSPLLLIAVIGLNMLAGFGCGWVYLNKGFEYAIMTHLAGDVALHLGGRWMV